MKENNGHIKKLLVKQVQGVPVFQSTCLKSRSKRIIKFISGRFLFILYLITVSYASSGTEPEKASRLNTAANAGYLSAFEKEIVFEINLFRSNPAEYAVKYIEPLSKMYKGKILHYPNDKPLLTKEGVKAVNECVRDLKKATPLPILYPSIGLSRAAADHVKDQSKTGGIGHYGKDGSTSRKRIERHGNWEARIAENIAYGGISARQVIIYLLIDDGVYDRGHRKNFLMADLKNVGVATGNHPVYNTMCVMDFSGPFTDK